MRMIIYIVLTVVGLLFFVAGVLGMYGSMLPATHTASVSVVVNAPREKVWELINSAEKFPEWLKDITKVEMLPEQDGKRVFRQHMGRNSFVLVETVSEAPSRVRRTITDDNGPFSGSWDHVLEDAGNGQTKLTVHEEGTIKSAIPRAMMKLFFGYDYYLKRMAVEMKGKLG
jgi:uncharacterized protein YndB with AHSA1/START domain